MSELGVVSEVRKEEKTTTGNEFCHIVMEGGNIAYCGYVCESTTTCKPYAGEAICPSCGFATCPTCAVQSHLNERLEEL